MTRGTVGKWNGAGVVSSETSERGRDPVERTAGVQKWMGDRQDVGDGGGRWRC